MNCTVYDKCSAPLCPEDKLDDTKDIWFPDEPICTSKSNQWIKVQRKIANKSKYPDRYFTIEMLKKDFVIGKNIKGLDPEKDQESQLKDWFRKHPSKKKLTEEEKANLRIKMIAVRVSKP